LALIALAVVSACGAPAGESTTTETTTTVTTEPPEDMVSQAIADLAARLRVPSSEIELIRFEEITWSDGSLGCPEPGKFYTQALVDGHRVILGHEDRVFLYHAGRDGVPFLCESDEDDGGHDLVPPPGFEI
jgi:hypothetical protein